MKSSLLEDFALLFSAGTDTTSNSALMMIYYCSANFEVMKNLLEEIDSFIEDDEDIKEEKLKEMRYLDAVFRETMRMYSPAPITFFRVAQEDHYL